MSPRRPWGKRPPRLLAHAHQSRAATRHRVDARQRVSVQRALCAARAESKRAMPHARASPCSPLPPVACSSMPGCPADSPHHALPSSSPRFSSLPSPPPFLRRPTSLFCRACFHTPGATAAASPARSRYRSNAESRQCATDNQPSEQPAAAVCRKVADAE